MSIDINAIAEEFIDMLNEWHALPEVYDNKLDAEIHRWYSDPPQVWPERPYFSPSSINSCPRELYMKAIGAKKDVSNRPPYQGRWQKIGTIIGDMIQRELLFIEKHYEAKTGKIPRFRFERDSQGRAMFEDFAKKNKKVVHNGRTFYLYGAPDGIMQYITEDGEILRIGLEIKSKQTSAATTSLYSMREPDPKHVAQTIGYGEMFDVDYYLILYVNAAKKGWNIAPEDFVKTPDIRAFGVEITPEAKAKTFDYLTQVLDAMQKGAKPAVDLDKWTFNNFKTAVALSLDDEEYAILKAQVRRMMKSSLPDWRKNQFFEAIEFIKEAREAAR